MTAHEIIACVEHDLFKKAEQVLILRKTLEWHMEYAQLQYVEQAARDLASEARRLLRITGEGEEEER